MKKERAKRPVNEILEELLKRGSDSARKRHEKAVSGDPWITNGQAAPSLFGICINDPIEGPLEIVFELPPGASCPLCDELHQDRETV